MRDQLFRGVTATPPERRLTPGVPVGSMSEERRQERVERFFRRLEKSLGSEIARAAADELEAAQAFGPTIAVEKPDPTGLSASDNVRVRQPPTPYSGNNSGHPYPGGLPSLRRSVVWIRVPARQASKAEDEHLTAADIDAVIAALGDHYSPERAAIVERLLRKYAGTIPDAYLIEEIRQALAIHQRGREPGGPDR
jgi:hypothetical protein